MCLEVKKVYNKGEYKETTYKGNMGDKYSIATWQNCGHCIECMNRKANNWLVRNKYEATAHKDKCFITLTYAKNPRYLIRKHIQDFMKRLRKQLTKEGIKIRYFGCGEYGTLKGRPHYHAIIYGWKPQDAKFEKWSKKMCAIYQSEMLTRIWGHGRTAVQRAEDKTIPYMALYQSPNLENRRAVYANKDELMKLYEKDYKKFLDMEKKLSKQQGQYYEVKEFNFYSQGVGFKEFIKDYENKNETWKHYQGDMELATPSPWIYVMAKIGEKNAIIEMKRRREFEEIREQTVEERRVEKGAKVAAQHYKEVIQKIQKPLENLYF